MRSTHGLPAADADRLARDSVARHFFEATLELHPNARSVAAWVLNEVRGELARSEGSKSGLTPSGLAELLGMVDDGKISGKIAKEVLTESIETQARPGEIVEQRGLEQISDRADLIRSIDTVLEAHPQQVEAYRAGKGALKGFFIGQVMKATSGRANPELVQQLLSERLDGPL